MKVMKTYKLKKNDEIREFTNERYKSKKLGLFLPNEQNYATPECRENCSYMFFDYEKYDGVKDLKKGAPYWPYIWTLSYKTSTSNNKKIDWLNLLLAIILFFIYYFIILALIFFFIRLRKEIKFKQCVLKTYLINGWDFVSEEDKKIALSKKFLRKAYNQYKNNEIDFKKRDLDKAKRRNDKVTFYILCYCFLITLAGIAVLWAYVWVLWWI